MHGPDEWNSLWLSFTNIALGLVTLACVFAIAGGVARDLLFRREKPATAARDEHAFATPTLGVTMSDGGERIDGGKSRPPIER